MSADEIAASIANGIDPWSEDLNGVQPPPTYDLPLHSLQCALQFSALLPSADDLAAIFAVRVNLMLGGSCSCLASGK